MVKKAKCYREKLKSDSIKYEAQIKNQLERLKKTLKNTLQLNGEKKEKLI